MVTNQFKDLIYGLYGKTLTSIDPEVQKLVLKHCKRGQTPVTGPPAYYLEPELAEDRKKSGDLAKNDEDLLIYSLYPATGEQFLKWKYGIEPMPENMKPPQAPEETKGK